MNQITRCDWLPERARWSYLARSGQPAASRKKKFPESHVINPLLTKLVRSRWLDIGLVLFLRVYGPPLRFGPLTSKKELGQYPAILTSHLVNNPYILNSGIQAVSYLRKLFRRYGDFFVNSETARNSQGQIFILKVSFCLLNMHCKLNSLILIDIYIHSLARSFI